MSKLNVETRDNVRVALWCCQRSMSTLFERCIASGGDVEIFHEVYLAAYRFGPQHTQENATFDTDDSYTFENVHKMLSQNFPPKRAVFLKDMAFAVEGRFSELSPEFYHTFLIRSPQKVVRSYLKLLHGCHFDENYVAELRRKLPNSFRQQCLLYDYITEHGYQSKITVIDADDFVTMPELVLRRYCQEAELTVQGCMLRWESVDSLPEDWHCSMVLQRATEGAGSYDRALHSTGFEPPDLEADGGSAAHGQDISSDWQRCIDECGQFYKIMFARRIVIDK